jgi:hypothetical protein
MATRYVKGVADPKPGDRRVVGDLVGADHPEGDVLATAALDPARASPADAVGVGEQGEHHFRIVGGGAVAVLICLARSGSAEMAELGLRWPLDAVA